MFIRILILYMMIIDNRKHIGNSNVTKIRLQTSGASQTKPSWKKEFISIYVRKLIVTKIQLKQMFINKKWKSNIIYF